MNSNNHPGPDPNPSRAVLAAEHFRGPSSHLALALASPSPAPLPPSVKVISTPEGKTRPVLTPYPAVLPKPVGTHRLMGLLPHEETPSRLGQVAAFLFLFLPNLIETEKVKQNKKAEEFVSNERTRQKCLKND